MTANTVNGSGKGARSGAQTLLVLAAPLNVHILRSLSDGTKQQVELRRETDFPAQSTLRAQLKRLIAFGVIDKHRRNGFPGVLGYELTPAGRELLFVANVLEHWLGNGPGGELRLGGPAAKAVIGALAEAWSSTMLRALASGPLSLTELDGVIAALSYPSLERRLAALRLAGLVEPRPANGTGRPYGVTEWLRGGVAPLAGAARWERRRRPHHTAAVAPLDIEATFLLTVPLLRLPEELSGRCRIAAELHKGDARRLVGVTIEVDRGGIVSCTTQMGERPGAWAVGPSGAWLEALVEHDAGNLELGGNRSLVRALLDSLNKALFAVDRVDDRQPKP